MKRGISSYIMLIIVAIIIAVLIIIFSSNILLQGNKTLVPIIGNSSELAKETGEKIQP